MEKVSIVGMDLAKNVFHVHGARSDGSVSFRKKLSRNKVLMFFAAQPKCVVAMEACASAHYWAREIGDLGHAVKLIPPICKTVREAAEERRGRCRSHCRGRLAPDHALCRGKDRGAAGSGADHDHLKPSAIFSGDGERYSCAHPIETHAPQKRGIPNRTPLFRSIH